jgi:hypothetical protein
VENANVTLGGKAMRVINKWQHTKLEVHVTKIAALNVWTIFLVDAKFHLITIQRYGIKTVNPQ